MHPPRRYSATEHQGTADRLADWLLGHCPFTTLTVLIMIVIGPSFGPPPQPIVLAVPVVLADLTINLLRRVSRRSV